MGVYVGYIEKKGYDPSVFFNFRPIAEIEESQIHLLSSEDQGELLPESERRNINFYFSWNNAEERRQMDAVFGEKSLVIFEFVPEDLQDNIKSTGERNPTGYKVSAIDMLNAKKIRPIHTAGAYYTVPRNKLLSNFSNDTIVEIDIPYVLSGDQVFVEYEGFWVGPYEVGYREYTSSYYIKPQIRENKYTVCGYRQSDVLLRTLPFFDSYWDISDNMWTILIPKQDVIPEQIDVITKEALLVSFRDSLQNGVAVGGEIKLDDIPALLKRYEDSSLSGAPLTDEIRRNRLNRLVDILTSEEDIDETLSTIADCICDLLVKYQDNSHVEGWLQVLLEKQPQLIEQFRDSQAISERIAQMEQSLDDLQLERSKLEQEIAKRKVEAEEIDRSAIEAKKTELLRMDSEYTDLCAKLETVKKSLGIVGSVADLQKKQEEYQREVAYLESHKNHLERDTSGLEVQFQQLISQPHEKMVGIAFDGFMASKMLHAASQWESENSAHHCEDLMTKVNGVSVSDKTAEELVDYLCKTIQIVRPTYSKNTIINIAICLTQGFLTVFSGEPGCGKTSICNIFGEALGLNKIAEFVDFTGNPDEIVNRFIPVSVERGWTSKRDFVGYYNPLSKTFDKSNRRIFDALQQLDTEKHHGISKLPYIILLDEANLSPMEYYWSDFMNICDDLGSQSEVNLGEDNIFGIPETLHFLATINNDHTTEMLSPRLLDRAWIVSLPQQYNATYTNSKLPADQIEIISWGSLREAFVPEKEKCVLSPETQKIYDTIISKLREKRFVVSPRVDKAIKSYWASAARHFEMDETKTSADIVALDYAVAQRILPKIAGNGEIFEQWLEDFKSLCSGHGLNMSAKILKDIIDRGNEQMKYYQFF